MNLIFYLWTPQCECTQLVHHIIIDEVANNSTIVHVDKCDIAAESISDVTVQDNTQQDIEMLSTTESNYNDFELRTCIVLLKVILLLNPPVLLMFMYKNPLGKTLKCQ